MSGEHGDGLARSLWNAQAVRARGLRGASRQVKRAFDPENRLNPGKVVGAADPGDHLRIGPDYHPHEPADTLLDFSGQGGFARAVEMCSGVGACRKTGTGTMCPSYMVTRDEMHTTRGRANALRLVMSGELPSHGSGLANETLFEALDLCLQCKACKSECPSQVDMAKLKAEFLHQYYAGGPRPLEPPADGPDLPAQPDRLGASPRWPTATLRQPAVQVAPGEDRRASTAGGRCRRSSATISASGSTATRPIPAPGRAGAVVLLDDCFTTYNNPEVGIAAVRVLEAAGYRVSWPACAAAAGRRSPRGCSKLGRELARENVAEAAAAMPGRACRSSAASRAAW